MGKDIANETGDGDNKKKEINKWQVAVLILLCLGVIAGVIIGTLFAREWESYEYKHAAVASDNPQCSTIGKDILKQGGNAVDAAISTLLCVGLHNAHSAGIGGGSFMIIADKKKEDQSYRMYAFDFREEAPGQANQNMFVNDTTDASVYGGLAIGVPGEVNGYWTVHKKHGRLPWKNLFVPNIELARNGFTVNKALANAIRGKKDIIEEDPSLSEVFVHPDGRLFEEGDTMYRLKLARTYERIANEGGDEFYQGELAEDIVKDINDRDGIITLEDLNNYSCKERKPISITITTTNEEKSLRMFSLPPPSSGAVMALILNILDEYKFNEDSLEDKVEIYHHIVEAFKFAYAKRSALGDEDYVDVVELVKNMTSDIYAKELKSKITYYTHNTSYYGPLFANNEDFGTAHLSVVDEDGMAVSVTSTINTHFGSKVRGTRTGIIFNNEMDDFSTPGTRNTFGVPASPSNFIKPGKRPMSSMCPSIFIDEEEKVRLIIGASGGTRITTGTSLATMNTLWFGKNIENAIKEPRIHHQLVPIYIAYEKEFSKEILHGLESRLHEVKQSSSSSVVQGIKRKSNNYLTAYCDDRKGGKPAGY
ncbi:glutathione hydrolase 1 proenzyme-like [Antedon mediterranea]|uniref:glutathione hydrolase 1 proenzyme-like n=1 Tax=Antedon mediterranea TaxID=105859 RepID=UPI003AF80E55